MKKSLFIIAATALVVSCASNDVKNDIVQEDVAIGFVPAFMEKVTKANAGEMSISPNTFEKDHNTFAVWGWKTNATETTKVFDNQLVEYLAAHLNTTPSTGWAYTPLKYWDRGASYKFYAAAPYNYFTFDGTTRKFSATSVPSVQTIQNKNASSQANLIDLAYTENGHGTNSTAIDYLVAAKVECGTGADNQSNNLGDNRKDDDKDVEFIFSHILSKLTVRALTTSDFAPSGKPDIKLTKLEISLNGMSQSYAQLAEGYTQADSIDKDVWSSAISSAVTETCFYADDNSQTNFGVDSLLLSATAQELASYFVAPTTTGTTGGSYSGTADVTVQAWYTVFYSDGVVDNCVSPVTTVANLNRFVQNNWYFLDVKISPEAILFDVNSVVGFDTNINGNDKADDEIEQEVH